MIWTLFFFLLFVFFGAAMLLFAGAHTNEAEWDDRDDWWGV